MRDREFYADIWEKTATQWAALDPFLSKNDLGVESDTGRIKVGIGQKWSNTPYVATTITIGLADVQVTLPQDGAGINGNTLPNPVPNAKALF